MNTFKKICFCGFFLCVFSYGYNDFDTDLDSPDEEVLISDEELDSQLFRALYSLPSKVWLESVYRFGRPSAKVWARIAFESPELALTIIGAPKGGIPKEDFLRIALINIDISRKEILGIVEDYTDDPEKACKELANSLMSAGMEGYRENYELYREWKFEKRMSDWKRQEFVEKNFIANYLGLGKELWGDIELYKRREGKYREAPSFKAVSNEMKRRLSLLTGGIDLLGISDEGFFEIVQNIFTVAQEGLREYPPYRDHMARIVQLEDRTGKEFPLTKLDSPQLKGLEEEIRAEEKELVLKNPPDRPLIATAYIAIDLANVEQVWSHIYHYKSRINGANRERSWLTYALIKDQEYRIECLRDLIKKDPSIKDKTLSEIYNLTKSEEYNSIIRLLILNGADINIEESDITPLGLAIGAYNVEAIRMLVDAGVDLNTPYRRHSILEVVALAHDENLLGYLLKRGATRGKNDAMVSAVSVRNRRMVELLIEHGAEINSYSDSLFFTPLTMALRNNDFPMVIFLLENGADVSFVGKDNLRPIHSAVLTKSLSVVNIFHHEGADLNVLTREMTPLTFAVNGGLFEIAEYLIKNGADVNLGKTFFEAVVLGDMKMLNLLIENGAEVKGRTAFAGVFSSKGNRAEIAKILISKGAEIVSQDLFSASRMGDVELAKVLVDNGADPLVRRPSGITLLHLAGNAAMVRFLVSKGVDLDARDEDKRTALHEACINLRLDAAVELIESGALLNPLDKEGRTPCDYAHGRNTSESNRAYDALHKYGLKPRMLWHGTKGYNERTRDWNGAPYASSSANTWEDRFALLRWEGSNK